MHDTAPIAIPQHQLEPVHAVREIEVPGAKVFRRGKVRSCWPPFLRWPA